MRFYLGCHHPSWLWDASIDFPLFVSFRQLGKVAKPRRATTRWALDSGDFTELSQFGQWTVDVCDYVEAVARFEREVGRLDFAAGQDWMCEPEMIHGGVLNGVRVPGTGLSVAEHQRRTVENYLELSELWPAVSDSLCPFIPTLQGYSLGEYRDGADLYEAVGVRLAECRTVGLGSVCRRQNMMRASMIVSLFADEGLRLHGFGFKTEGLRSCGHQLASADSLSWSYDARRAGRAASGVYGCPHASCANCSTYARDWRRDLLDRLGSCERAA
jgi:hypothetical protein